MSATLELWACLGDSLTNEPSPPPTTVLSAWPARVDLAIFASGRGATNHGINGTRLNTDNGAGLSMKKRYDANIHDRGYYGAVLWGGTNDLLADESGPSVFADYNLILQTMLNDGLKVIGVITPPCAGYSGSGGWSPSRQTAIEAFRTLALGLVGSHPNLTMVDLYKPTNQGGMGDPANPTFLDPRFSVDGIHYNEDGQTFVLLPTFIPLMQAELDEDETTELAIFGVTPIAVRRHHFANWQYDFSPTTAPTEATVEEMIADAAGEFAGRLTEMEIDPTTITVDSAAYVQLRNVLRKTVAVRVMEDATDQDSALLTKWQDQLDAFWKRVEDKGPATLGNESLSSSASEPEGPTTHLDELGIDLGDVAGDASDGVPPFRKDDQL